MTKCFILLPNQSIDLEQVDKWIKNVLKADVEPCQISLSTGNDKDKNHIIQIVWRTLIVRKIFLQALKIPVFDSGDILAINREKGNYKITTQLVLLNQIFHQVNSNVLSIAVNTIINFFQRKHNTKDIKNFFEYLEKNLYKEHNTSSWSGGSTIPILREAWEQNIPFFHFHGKKTYQLGWGKNRHILSASSLELDSAIGARLSTNKVNTAKIIREAGLPAPMHKVANQENEVFLIAKKLGFPIVTKPIDLNGGVGITIDINDEEKLKEGFQLAYKSSMSKQVVVEKQVEGVCYRILISNNKIVYAIKRLPISVSGDGKKTIENLISEANIKNMNLPQWKRWEVFPNDQEAIQVINKAGYTLKDIPKKGELIPLRKIESTQWGGIYEDVTHSIHTENIEIALKTAKLFNLQVAGVDIMSSDITKPWYENGAIIIEINYSPAYGDEYISKESIKKFLIDFMDGDGRIPITVIVGNKDAMDRARTVQEQALQNNIKTFITTHNQTITDNQKNRIITLDSLYKRTKALLMDKDVEGLILVVQNYELLETGLPVDNIDKLIITNENIPKLDSKDKSFTTLISLLESVI